MKDEIVLCCANRYLEKYYFNEEYKKIPEDVQNELRIICTLFTEDVGGIMWMAFDEEGNLMLKTVHEEDDFLYDDIGAELKIKQILTEKRELLEALERYHQAKQENKF